ncbi:WD-40 repeat protein, partial [Reticulomyxa filosa]
MFDTFCSSAKLINTFTGHTRVVYSIDYSIFDDSQLICSGSSDKTVRVWDVVNNKQIQSFNEHSNYVYCVKFSSYHYHNNHQNVICSSSFDKTIRFGISNIINNCKYSMDTLMVLLVLNFHHLMV